MKKIPEQERIYYRQLIWDNALDLFEKKNSLTHNLIIKSQRRFINKLNVLGKNKYKSIDVLNNYFKNPDKSLAEQIFYTTIKKKVNLNKICFD